MRLLRLASDDLRGRENDDERKFACNHEGRDEYLSFQLRDALGGSSIIKIVE